MVTERCLTRLCCQSTPLRGNCQCDAERSIETTAPSSATSVWVRALSWLDVWLRDTIVRDAAAIFTRAYHEVYPKAKALEGYLLCVLEPRATI